MSSHVRGRHASAETGRAYAECDVASSTSLLRGLFGGFTPCDSFRVSSRTLSECFDFFRELLLLSQE
jgi:hypothetical protein